MRHFDETEVVAAVTGSGGILRLIAEKLGCDRTTIGRWRDRSKAVSKAIKDERESNLDVAESKLIEAVKEGKPWAVRFYLSSQGKHRGYNSRSEAPTEPTAQVVVYKLPDNGRGDRFPVTG